MERGHAGALQPAVLCDVNHNGHYRVSATMIFWGACAQEMFLTQVYNCQARIDGTIAATFQNSGGRGTCGIS
jgi:hypothetical protein